MIIGDRESGPVLLVPYDPHWALRFQDEKRRIADAVGAQAQRIEHIGSTAVPGLMAKPIIDILVEVDNIEDDIGYAPALESAGYVLRVSEPGHRMFRPAAKDVYVHLWQTGDQQIARHLAFRDRLRTHQGDRSRYELAKKKLAQREWADRNEYAEAKTEIIDEILRSTSPE